MPPVSAAVYMMLGLFESTAMSFTRPVDVGEPGDWPTAMGDGPIDVQVNPLSGIEMDGRSRFSHRSTPSLVRAGRRIGAGRRRAKRVSSQPRCRCFLMMSFPRRKDARVTCDMDAA